MNRPSVDIHRKHILWHRFRHQYHDRVWHGVREFTKENYSNGYETDEENVNEHAYCVDEMMKEVEDELVKRSCVVDLLIEAFQMPLYPGCAKFTKLTIVLIIFNIKSKFNLSDISFIML